MSGYRRSRKGRLESYVDIPQEQMGLVIGKGGVRIQHIGTVTGTNVFTKRSVRNRLFIEAETEEGIERAKQELLRIVVSMHPTYNSTVFSGTYLYAEGGQAQTRGF
jgi:polyribonucleotide nucleotidyltransferase